MQKLRFAVIGCGFWSQFQIAAWHEFRDEAELVAVCDQDLQKANTRAAEFGHVPSYTDAEEMLRQESLDFVDVITDVDTHERFVKLAADFGVAVICQKPMAPDLETAEEMVRYCTERNVSFMVHENFRWQAPFRRFKTLLDSGLIGTPFKGRITFCSNFPVFENQPFLAELDQFILTDIGSHILDMTRFLFGEARSLHCMTRTVNPRIKGEDVANVFMEMEKGVHCYVEMSYASILEQETFPETLVLAEGSEGSLALEYGGIISITSPEGTEREQVQLAQYEWADPDYALIHSSIVACNRDILSALQGKKACETDSNDNIRTVRLFFDAYRSAAQQQIITYPNT